MFYYYDPTYWLIILGAIVALYAQIKVSTTYSKWSKVPSSTRMTGAQMARQILDGNGCENVRIERISGKLTITMTRKTACSACPARSTVRIPSRRWAWPRTKRDTPFRTRRITRRCASARRWCRLPTSVRVRRFRCSCSA